MRVLEMTANNGLWFGLLLLFTGVASGQGPELAPQEPSNFALTEVAKLPAGLVQAANNAKANFRPLTTEDVETARSTLAQRSVALENRVGPASSYGAAWLDFLKWNGVQKQLAPNSEVDLPAARTALKQLMSGTPGLEVPESASRCGRAGEVYRYRLVPSGQRSKRRVQQTDR